MDLRFYTGSQFPAAYRNALFLALHGSSNDPDEGRLQGRPRGDEGRQPAGTEDFMTGWLKDGEVTGRPAGLATGRRRRALCVGRQQGVHLPRQLRSLVAASLAAPLLARDNREGAQEIKRAGGQEALPQATISAGPPNRIRGRPRSAATLPERQEKDLLISCPPDLLCSPDGTTTRIATGSTRKPQAMLWLSPELAIGPRASTTADRSPRRRANGPRPS